MGEALDWPVAAGSCLMLGAGLGTLRWAERAGGLDPKRLPARVSVRRRRGGETLKTAPRARTQSVQHLCQALGVLPWLRDALPLVYAGETLIAVGDLWQDARSSVAPDTVGLGCVWEDAPPLT
jgi:tRNA(Ile)-lysidine synthase